MFPDYRNKKRKMGRDERESSSELCVCISRVNCLRGDDMRRDGFYVI